MVLALAELIAAWNCVLQSEKSMLAATGAEDEPAEDEPAEDEPAEAEAELLLAEAGGVSRSVEVHAALASVARPAASTVRRV